MTCPKKEILFDEFLSNWDTEFKQVPNIINYISSYYKLAFKFVKYSINNTPERIRKSQIEWVALVSQFEHPLEKEFFKTYWVPIESDSYDLFIDLSSKTFTLFEVHYFPFEPFNWYKKVWFEDMGEFLAWATDSSVDIDKHLKENDQKFQEIEKELFKNRDLLGYAGKIENRIVEKEDILTEDSNGTIHHDENSIIITKTTSLIIGLLPEDIKISLISLDGKSSLCCFSKITTIKSFVYHLQKSGFISINEYRLSLDPFDSSYVVFKEGSFTLRHIEKSRIKDFIDCYETKTGIIIDPAPRPLFKYFCQGYPSALVSFIPEAAKELKINLSIEYHGCIIRTVYTDDHGLEITDAQIRALEIEEENKSAVDFYNNHIGEDWLEKLKLKALELLENSEDDGLPF